VAAGFAGRTSNWRRQPCSRYASGVASVVGAGARGLCAHAGARWIAATTGGTAHVKRSCAHAAGAHIPHGAVVAVIALCAIAKVDRGAFTCHIYTKDSVNWCRNVDQYLVLALHPEVQTFKENALPQTTAVKPVYVTGNNWSLAPQWRNEPLQQPADQQRPTWI
jgi:hypothetical protein